MQHKPQNIRQRKVKALSKARQPTHTISPTVPFTMATTTSSTTATQMEISHVCLALNNLGVQMLEHGHFYQACKAFKAAVSSLKLLRNKTIAPMPCVADMTSELARARAALAKATIQSTQPAENVTPVVEICPIEEGDQAGLASAEQYGPTFSLVFPIRFRDLISNPELLQTNMDFYTAVLLYNYGLARLLFQRFSPSKSLPSPLNEAQRFLAAAQHYFVLAEGVVTRNLVQFRRRQSNGGNQLQADDDRQVWFFALAALILSNQWIIYSLQGRNDKVARVNESLGKLHQHLQQWQEQNIGHFLLVERPNGMGAPAA